jgi:hypothetical protein
MKTIARAQREPSARSLREMPAMDLTQASRRNPYAARIAKEGYTVHVSRGRPRKGEETGPTVTKSVRLPPEVWNRLKERALAEGVPLHALLRAALLAWLERAA